jgi:putative aldouronate transport system substrate-binding protein
MEENMKRFFSLAALFALGFSLVFAGGSQNKTTNAGKKSDVFTISYWVPMHTNAAKVLTTWNDNESFQELERRTGVHVDFIHPPVGQDVEQYNLMIASRNLPDIICYNYPDGADKAFAEKIYRPLDDLMKYNPNMQAIMDSNSEVRKQMTTNNGHIWGWGQFSLPERQGDKGQYSVDPWAGPAVRADWLEELGLGVPGTIDEWYNMLVQFRDKKAAQVPLILSKNGQPWVSVFMGAYGTGAGFYRENNVVKYGPVEKGYKNYLALMNKWYNENLLDPDFASTASDSNFYAEYLTTGKAGAIDVTYQDIVPLYNSLFDNKKNRVTAIPYPTLKKGEILHLGNVSPVVESANARRDYLTTAVSEDRLEAVCKWRDNWYTEESYMLFNYGIGGRSYNMVNGKPVFTDLIANNPDGLDYAVSSWKYKFFCHSYVYNAFAMPDPQIEASWSSMGTWKSNNDRANQMPPSEIPMEVSTEYNNIMAEVNTYRDQMVLKFIMGDEPLDKFDAYVAQLKAIGIDKVIKYQQDGLDLYNSH